MATLKRKYSWWSPKNSKWLPENLAGMDANVTVMIKLIKQDAVHFSRRPKMNYKKRPDQLLKLVGESYRAYRALAERYDYAIGALHKAHKITSEAFPNQVLFNDDSPSLGSQGAEGFKMPQPVRAFLYPEDLHKKGAGLSPTQSHSAGKKRLRQGDYMFGSGGGAAEQAKFAKRSVTNDQNIGNKDNDPKALTEHKVKEHEQSSKNGFSGQNIKTRVISEDELVGKVDDVVLKLKQMIAKLQAGKKASLYQLSLEKVSNMELRELSEQAIKEEKELGPLVHSFSMAKTGVANYLQCLESFSALETKLSHSQEEAAVVNERASKAETEVQNLKQDYTRLKGENEAAILQYKQCLEKISELETELSHAEDKAKRHTMSMKNLQAEVLCLKETEEAGLLNEQVLNERANKAETEVQILKQDLTKLEGENEAAILRYNQSLEKISDLETELSHAEDEARRLTERSKVLEEKNLSCTMSINNLQDEVLCLKEREDAGVLNEQVLNERANKAEAEVQVLKQDLTRLEGENEAAILQYNQSLEKISDLETELSHAEDEAKRHIERTKILDEKNLSCTMSIKNLEAEVLCLKEAEEAGVLNEQVLNERASKAETEVQILKQDLTRLKGENEAVILRYEQCLEKISDMETKLSHAGDETRRLAERSKVLEEKNLSCAMSIKNLQDEVLCLKEAEESGILNEQVTNERANKAETEVQILKQDLTRLEGENEAAILQYKQCLEKISDLETKLSHAEDETRRHINKTIILDEKNLSCAMAIKNLQDEVLCLKEAEENLKNQVELRLDEKNAFQQVIYCLKEELNELNVQYHSVVEQVEHAGLKPDSIELSVTSLQQEISKMKELYHEEKEEKASLLAKLEQMEKLLQNNAHLETSLLDVTAELEELREKQVALEETSQSLYQEKSNLVAEKAALVSQVEIATENLAKLAEKNIFLEKSLCDVNAEFEEAGIKSKSLEESLDSLKNERLGLVTERDTLVTKLESMHEKLEGLEKYCAELGEKHVYLEKEKDALLHEVTEVQGLLDQEKKMHASFAQSNEILIGNLENHIHILQEKHKLMENEIEKEQDKAMEAQLEIIIWQICVRNIEEKSYSLLIECQKHLEASKLSEKLVADMEQKNLHQQLNVDTLSNQVSNLKMAIHQVLKLLEIDVDHECPDKTEHERLVQHILKKIEDNDGDLLQLQDDKQQLLFEKSVLVTVFQQAMWDLRNSRFAYQNENSKVLEEIKLLRKDYSNLKEENCMLEEENTGILEETMVLSNLCLVLKNFAAEKAAELKKLWKGLDSLQGINGGLEQEIKMMREEMQMVEAENLNLKVAVEKLEIEHNAIGAEKAAELKRLGEDLDSLQGINGGLEQEIKMMREGMQMVEAENSNLKAAVEKLEIELNAIGAEKAAELKRLGEGLDSLQGINGGLEQEIKMMREGMQMVEAEKLNLIAAVEKLETELNAIRTQKDLELRSGNVYNTDLDDERTAEFVKLKGSLCALVGENKEMKSEMTKYAQDMGPLVESIKHVEDLVFSHLSSPSADGQEIKEVAKPQHDKSSQQLSGDHYFTMSDGIPDLQDLQRRVKAFEKALIEMRRLTQQESVDSNIKTGKAILVEPKEVERKDDLKGIDTRKSEHDISSGEKNVIIVKDIPLDQVASSSSYVHGDDLHATSLRRSSWIDEKQLESWGIIEKDWTNSPTVLQEEKEMVVDNLKVSKRVSWAHGEENKKDVLQRLTCDNLKLSNLKGTVQGLKKKVEKIPKKRRTEHFEYDKVEGQLQEVGEAITQLIDSNKKLRKSLEESRDVKAELKSKESGNVSVEAQKMSETIECLNLEVQKMQLVLMKLDNKHGIERSTSAPARRQRVLLRDFLYSDKEKQNERESMGLSK